MKERKGEFRGDCNRTSCINKDAVYYNHSTRLYYCVYCAVMLNQVNYSDAMRLFGHDLCTLGENIQKV
jgi:hypothetical protein